VAIIENINVSSPNDNLGDSLRNSQIKANNNFAELNDKKVEKIAGKDLSENDFTDALKTKLDSLEVGAGVQIQSDWIQTDNLALDYIKNKPDLSQYFSAVGGFDYEDLATQTTPLSYTTGYLQLTNDTLGENTKTNLNPYGVTSVWDSVTNTFDFSQLSIGDEVFLSVHLKITHSTAEQTSGLSLLLGEGTPSEYRLPIDLEIYHKNAGVLDVTKEISFYLGNEDRRTTPVKLQFNSDANATVQVYRWHPYIVRKSVNILDVNDDNYKTFEIVNIEADNDDTVVDDGKVSIGYNSLTDKINSILFDVAFSGYISNYDVLNSIYDFSINFADKTNEKSYTSFITGFTPIGARYKLDLEETIDFTEYSINDKIEVFINATKTTPVINDSAGDGNLTQTWSANKLHDDLLLKADLISGKVPASQLPSYVDDVIEVANFGALPVTGEAGKIYLTLDTELIYRWSGTMYVEVSPNAIPNLQQVTDEGNTTTNEIIINAIRFYAIGSTISISDISVNPLASRSVHIGFQTGVVSTGDSNLFFGTSAFQLNTTGGPNIGIGDSAGKNNTIGFLNIYIGHETGGFNAAGKRNIGLGPYVFEQVTSGDDNLGFGDNAFTGFTAGNRNLCIGTNTTVPNGDDQFNIWDFLFKDSAGNFGIDTDTPTAKLDVNGSTRLRGGLFDFNNQAGTSGQLLSATGSGVDWITPNFWGLTGNAGTNPATNFIGTTDNQNVIFKRNNLELFRLKSDGSSFTSNSNFEIELINNATAQRLSYISSHNFSLANVISISSNYKYINGTIPHSDRASGFIEVVSATDESRFVVSTNNSINTNPIERFRISGNGNVGIGVTNPTKLLDINGEARIRTLPAGLSTENILVVNANGDVRSVAGATASRLQGYTVATLPAGTIGDVAYVTDALAPTYLAVAVGGGAVTCPVFYNGSAWVSH
jgi:hypothetical protein